MSVYEKITQGIIEQLEQGTVPWRKPWRSTLPKNLVSQKPYRGINTVVLAMHGRTSPYWATFRQIKKAGGSVRKGERGTHIVFTNWFKVEDEETGEERQLPFLKSYTVFNLDQTTGIEVQDEEPPMPITPIERCEEIARAMPPGPTIRHNGGSSAFYRPPTDSVHLPLRDNFGSAEGYYSTLFHELVHSTGHQSRLARKGVTEITGFGTDAYSNEELVAELGAAFLCGRTGIAPHTLENSAAYIDNWLSKLKSDKKLVVIAAAQAQKAVDFICDEGRPADEKRGATWR
jgi:antirestriction protein ArdC